MLAFNSVTISVNEYQCHKKVWALKIQSVMKDADGDWVIVPVKFASFNVSKNYVENHKPEPGGYYIMYKDGYQSYSSAQAFEEGYTKL